MLAFLMLEPSCNFPQFLQCAPRKQRVSARTCIFSAGNMSFSAEKLVFLYTVLFLQQSPLFCSLVLGLRNIMNASFVWDDL